MVTTHQKARIHTQNIKRNTNPIVKVVIKSQENIKGKNLQPRILYQQDLDSDLTEMSKALQRSKR